MPRSRSLTATLAVVGAVLIASCSQGGARSPGTVGVITVDVPRAAAGSAPVAGVTAGMLAFAVDLYRSAAQDGLNTVVSPMSVAVAASMLRAGAGGQTAAEIDRVLRFPPVGRDAAFNRLLHEIVTTDRAPESPTPGPAATDGSYPAPIVAIANGLFVGKHQLIGQPFLGTLASDYGAGLQSVDFALPSATDILNSWVRTHTAGRISRLFDGLDPATKVVLANAVYLKAHWAAPFELALTKPAPFHRTNGTITAPTMHEEETLSYAAGPGWQAVELPYAGGNLAMRLLIPTGSETVAQVLTPAILAGLASSFKPAFVDLSMPRWNFATNLDLAAALTHLGMGTAFSAAADLTAIAPGLSVTAAIHRATITVDEQGTEAAAVTGFGAGTSALLNPQIVVVRADRPFAFEVVHLGTGTPLFIGSVADPTAQS